MDGQQLHCRYAKVLEVIDDGRVRHAGIGTAEFFGDLRVGHRHTLNVGFVNDGLVIRGMGAVVAVPLEERVNDN